MEAVYEREWEVPSSMCDHDGRLGLVDTFNLFMDVATVHALELGCGWRQMLPRDLFWLTVRTKIVFGPTETRPLMADAITLRTWPEAPDKMRCLRDYQLDWQGRTVISGKTEWAILNLKTQRLVPAAEVYPEGLAFDREPACPAPFVRVIDDFDGVEPFATYTVRATDIDLGGHMNNVVYLRAMLGAFPVAEQRKLDIREIDAIFRAQSFEGDVLTLQRRDVPGGMDVRLAREDKTVFLAHLACAGVR